VQNRILRSIGLILAFALAAGAAGARAQDGGTSVVAPVPFGPGERATYKVRLGIFGTVGAGSMEILGIQELRDRPAYHIRFDLEGGVLFAKVDDRMESWLDVGRLYSHRFFQDQKEVNYKRRRTLEFHPEEGRWENADKPGDGGELASDAPLDDVSFLYFVRTLPLEVGRTYTFNRYYKASGNPVVLKVLRRETVKVPAGTFETVVVQPLIRTSGLFSEGGRAEVYISDDERRLLVRVKSHVPVIGSMDLQMQAYTPGVPVTAAEMAARRPLP
jgi:hypothetical protein